MNLFGDKLLGGKYRLESVLGEGGMGLVVQAMHVALGQRFAIKLLNPEVAGSSEAVQRFQREAQIAAQLRGDHITRVTDFGQTEDGRPFLVMELLEGRDLAKELLTRGRLPISEAVDYVLQACKGVAEAHAAGLVHRDLKPSNLFLTRRPDGTPLVKVLDFGLSKPRTRPGEARLTHARTKLGTIEYSSPEQIRSAKDVDARTDQHALALILYELLTGRRAYKASTHGALSIIIATQEPPHPSALRPEIPDDLNAAVVRALAKDRRERFSDVVEFARAIAPSGSPDAWAAAGSIATTMASSSGELPSVGGDGPESGIGEDEGRTKLLRRSSGGGQRGPRPAAGAPPPGRENAREARPAGNGPTYANEPVAKGGTQPLAVRSASAQAARAAAAAAAAAPPAAAVSAAAAQSAQPGYVPSPDTGSVLAAIERQASRKRRPDMRLVLSVAFLAMVAAAVITFLVLASLRRTASAPASPMLGAAMAVADR